MTTKLENKMLSVNFAFVAPMVELADTPVLGTGLARGTCSSHVRRTKKTSLSNNTGYKFVARDVALKTKCCSVERVCETEYSF